MIKVSELRKRQGLTQRQLGELLGIDQTSISNWERGKGLPDTANQFKLANFFGVSLDYLLGRIQTRNIVKLEGSDTDLITYAAKNGLTIEDLMEFIDFINRIKQKDIDNASF